MVEEVEEEEKVEVVVAREVAEEAHPERIDHQEPKLLLIPRELPKSELLTC